MERRRGTYRNALHTVSGALTGGFSRAIGAGTVAGAADYLGGLQKQAEASFVEQGVSPEAAKALAQSLAQITSLGVGAAVGGTDGAATGLVTDTNNRQLHWKNFVAEHDECTKNPGGSGCATISKMAGVRSQVVDFMATPTANVVVNTDANGQVVSYTLLDKSTSQPLAVMEPLDFEAFRNAPAGFQALTARISPQYALDFGSTALEASVGNSGKAYDAFWAAVTSPEYLTDVALGVIGGVGAGGSIGKASIGKAAGSAEAGVGNLARASEQAGANSLGVAADVAASGKTVTVFRVQGGTPPLASRNIIAIDVNGNPVIQNTTLNISIGDVSHAAHFQSLRLGSTVTSLSEFLCGTGS